MGVERPMQQWGEQPSASSLSEPPLSISSGPSSAPIAAPFALGGSPAAPAPAAPKPSPKPPAPTRPRLPQPSKSLSKKASYQITAGEPTQKDIEEIISRMAKKDKYGVFVNPVTEDIAPGYFTYDTSPMDFSTMRSKAAAGQYTTWAQVRATPIVFSFPRVGTRAPCSVASAKPRRAVLESHRPSRRLRRFEARFGQVLTSKSACGGSTLSRHHFVCGVQSVGQQPWT
jgi:hypothetical protein